MPRLVASERCILQENAYKLLKASDASKLSRAIEKSMFRARTMTRLRIGDVKSVFNRDVKITI